MAKIYTKKGDQGETCLVSGERVSKGHLRLEAYGTLDELNSVIGLAVSYMSQSTQKKELLASLESIFFQTQNNLFNLGSQLACADKKMMNQLPNISQKSIEEFEKKIDELTEQLPPLKNFILPGGSTSSSALHMARTVCRRAERLCIHLKEATSLEEVGGLTIPYLNRLSDFLFVAARFCNKIEKQTEVLWKK